MNRTRIPYADVNWPIVTGCARGCLWCWARGMAHRFDRSFAPAFHTERLAEPLRTRKPRRVLVAFTGDLFDPAIADEQIAAVFGVMAACPQHRFLVLTKRAERMAAWFQCAKMVAFRSVADGCGKLTPVGECLVAASVHLGDTWRTHATRGDWPLRNVWIGVSVTNQADADERIPHLLRCPAAVRWLSVEPLLGPLNLTPWIDYCDRRDVHGIVRNEAGQCSRCDAYCGVSWVAAGAMSGRLSTRTMGLDAEEWAMGLRDQCAAAGVAFAWKSPTGFPPLDGVVHDSMPEGRK